MKKPRTKTRADVKRVSSSRPKASLFAKEFRLEGKKHVKDELKFHSTYKTFAKACRKGQELFGYAMFHVNCGLYIPSAEEQLLAADFSKSLILDSI